LKEQDLKIFSDRFLFQVWEPANLRPQSQMLLVLKPIDRTGVPTEHSSTSFDKTFPPHLYSVDRGGPTAILIVVFPTEFGDMIGKDFWVFRPQEIVFV
jgi:hypothetical protein